jgi:hypothetical protein
MYGDDSATLRKIECVAAAAADRGDTAVEVLCDDVLAGDTNPGAVLESRMQILINLFDAISAWNELVADTAPGVDLQLYEVDAPGASEALVTWATARGIGIVFVRESHSPKVKLRRGWISVIRTQP